MTDKMAIVRSINNIGRIKSDSCNKIACNIRDSYIIKKLWISAAHISDVSDKEVDTQCRIRDDTLDWQLNPKLFEENFENL